MDVLYNWMGIKAGKVGLWSGLHRHTRMAKAGEKKVVHEEKASESVSFSVIASCITLSSWLPFSIMTRLF